MQNIRKYVGVALLVLLSTLMLMPKQFAEVFSGNSEGSFSLFSVMLTVMYNYSTLSLSLLTVGVALHCYAFYSKAYFAVETFEGKELKQGFYTWLSYPASCAHSFMVMGMWLAWLGSFYNYHMTTDVVHLVANEAPIGLPLLGLCWILFIKMRRAFQKESVPDSLLFKILDLFGHFGFYILMALVLDLHDHLIVLWVGVMFHSWILYRNSESMVSHFTYLRFRYTGQWNSSIAMVVFLMSVFVGVLGNSTATPVNATYKGTVGSEYQLFVSDTGAKLVTKKYSNVKIGNRYSIEPYTAKDAFSSNIMGVIMLSLLIALVTFGIRWLLYADE